MRIGSRSIALSNVAMAIAMCAGCASSNNPNEPAPTATVEMHFHSFEPASITIHANEAVLWKNTTPFVWHTVTFDSAQAERAKDVTLPAGVQPFDSGKISSGDHYEHVFTVPGTYRYFCQPHESKGMVGEVIVEP